ncbi:MAG: hypothetical protein IIY32_08070, partial [Thermoguttaceae bacterium]|nr:hypothetical protein [Thermoguttaceae bacterium]
MIFHTLNRTLTLGAVLLAAAASVLTAYGSEEEMQELLTRAEKIAPMLAEAPNYGARAASAETWNELARLPSAQNFVQEAEGLLK